MQSSTPCVPCVLCGAGRAAWDTVFDSSDATPLNYGPILYVSLIASILIGILAGESESLLIHPLASNDTDAPPDVLTVFMLAFIIYRPRRTRTHGPLHSDVEAVGEI